MLKIATSREKKHPKKKSNNKKKKNKKDAIKNNNKTIKIEAIKALRIRIEKNSKGKKTEYSKNNILTTM